MAKNLVDLLWRKESSASGASRRGPRARHSADDVVAGAIALADEGGLDAVTIRGVAHALGLTTMSIYTHVNSRADLLVLMVDEIHERTTAPIDGAGWRDRVRQVTQQNLDLFRSHPWMLDVDDPRTVAGPGTIAKYDRELHAFDGTGLSDVERDAALSFVLDFVRASGARMRERAEREEFGPFWDDAGPRLATYLGDGYPLAQSVGRAAGEAMGGPYDAEVAWEFGSARLLDGLTGIIAETKGV